MHERGAERETATGCGKLCAVVGRRPEAAEVTDVAILVLDIGTSGVRAAVVGADGVPRHDHYRETLPDSPADGLSEFDATAYAAAALACACESLADADAAGVAVEGIGISNQRGTAVVWDAATGVPVAPAQGWQDLRTLGDCLVLAAEGFRFAPNQAATKFAAIRNAVDPDGSRDLRYGTPETWLIWQLSGGESFVTDPTNSSLTGLTMADALSWDPAICARLGLPVAALPAIRPSSGPLGNATALGRDLPILGVAGDQQCSLVGQGCVRPGMAKITFGTGGMLDLVVGPQRPVEDMRAVGGTFPLVCWQRGDEVMWGIEAIMLSAGTNVQWLRDDLGIIASSGDSEAVAAACEDSGGVVYVPAQMGLGTPYWDYGARGTLVGLTRGSGRAEVTRAVLEGVAHRGVDLLEAAEADSGPRIERPRTDGGMSANAVFAQAVADLSGRPVEVAPVKDATTVGAAMLVGLESGLFADWDAVGDVWAPSRTVEPRSGFDRDAARARWSLAVERARSLVPRALRHRLLSVRRPPRRTAPPGRARPTGRRSTDPSRASRPRAERARALPPTGEPHLRAGPGRPPRPFATSGRSPDTRRESAPHPRGRPRAAVRPPRRRPRTGPPARTLR